MPVTLGGVLVAIAVCGTSVVYVSHTVQMAASSARLGQPLEAFISKWGEPVRTPYANARDFEKCPGRTQVARWTVMLESGRVSAIIGNACPLPSGPARIVSNQRASKRELCS